MRHRLSKIIVLAVLSVTALLVIVGSAFFWRLSQGPVSLDFMTQRIETEINKSLSGMSVTMSGAVLELDPKTYIPHFYLRDMVLFDEGGNLIAKSKRAAISFDRAALFRGALVPQSLEFLGSRIFVKRQLDGGLSLGFGNPQVPDNETVTIDEPAPGDDSSKADREGQVPPVPEATTKSLLDILSGTGQSSTASSLQDIRITGASIQLFDEANQANWFAPEADLIFKKMPYGFVVFAKASVASGAAPWKTEISANYRTQSRSFAVSARIEDLIPANVSDKIFALSQFAKVNVPLSGHAEMEISDTGVVTKASAEFAAAAGVVGLPEYIAHPIVIDEGALRVDYDAVTGGFNIVDSIILIGGSRAELSGRVDPVRAADGRLTDLKVDLKATNVSVDTQGTVVNPVLVDKVEFQGRASIEGASLDIDDLVVMSGNTGVRLRGKITGGDESAGISISGRVRDISADFLKKLWPPIVGPKSRKWISENVQSGRITDGSFNVNIPVNGLATALRQKVLPEDNIDFQFSMADVTTTYFKTLPPIQGASGTAHLTGDSFQLNINAGKVVLPSDSVVQVGPTSFKATNLLADEVPGVFSINLSADNSSLMELADQPSLNLLKNAGIATPAMSGQAQAQIDINMPLIKDVPHSRVESRAVIKIVNAAVKQVVPKVDLTEGTLTVTFDRQGINATGPMKLNGFPAKVSWQRPSGPNSVATATIVTELDDKERDKLGIKLGSFLQGPVKVTADISGLGESASIAVKADLANAEMHIDAISWSRPATPNTTASFDYQSNTESGRKINNIIIRGPGLSLKGDVVLKPDGGMKSADFSQIWLSDENNFSMTITPDGDGQDIAISGKSFDARPFVKSMVSKSTGATATPAATPKYSYNYNVTAQIDRVFAHRGEILTDVSAKLAIDNSALSTAEIEGKFLSGLAFALHLRPTEGGRELQINSGDGGATLRASNLYSKVAGGQLEFSALLASGGNSVVRNGQLIMRDFDVRNEAALADIDSRGKPRKSGPRREGLSFTKLNLPFTADAKFIRIGDTLLKGTDLGASADGIIRKADGAIDITGTIIPAYGLNSAVGKIPLFGEILTGGKGQGIFGLTFALGGSFAKPSFQVNPISAIAPGILRKFFEFDSSGQPYKPKTRE